MLTRDTDLSETTLNREEFSSSPPNSTPHRALHRRDSFYAAMTGGDMPVGTYLTPQTTRSAKKTTVTLQIKEKVIKPVTWEEAASALPPNKRLSGIRLVNCPLSLEAVQYLHDLITRKIFPFRGITHLDIVVNYHGQSLPFTDIGNFVANNEFDDTAFLQVSSVSLVNCGLTDSSSTIIGDTLQQMEPFHFIRRLDLSHNEIEESGAKSVIRFIETIRTKGEMGS